MLSVTFKLPPSGGLGMGQSIMEIGSGFKFLLSKFLIRFEISLKVEKVDDGRTPAIVI